MGEAAKCLLLPKQADADWFLRVFVSAAREDERPQPPSQVPQLSLRDSASPRESGNSFFSFQQQQSPLFKFSSRLANQAKSQNQISRRGNGPKHLLCCYIST